MTIDFLVNIARNAMIDRFSDSFFAQLYNKGTWN